MQEDGIRFLTNDMTYKRTKCFGFIANKFRFYFKGFFQLLSNVINSLIFD
ncbi:hypothetical protein CHCC14600_4133 [Bacillus licheniformis]|nr:hypothetical protein CHCC14814_0930 [Bacillus paralicheniformis]TWM86455.1 hypothetical protein CHCC14600_4133 [Bacillus licheniformis]